MHKVGSAQQIVPMIGLPRRIRGHLDGVVATIELGVSDGLIESVRSKIRIINARGYEHHSAEYLAAMISDTAGWIEHSRTKKPAKYFRALVGLPIR